MNATGVSPLATGFCVIMLMSYQQLEVWQVGVNLVEEIYRLTKLFPKEELYGLTSQIRRAAVSIPANVAEGYTRKHRPEYTQFIRIAFASGAELETLLLIAKKLCLAGIEQFSKCEDLLSRVMKMLNRLISALVARP